VACNRWGRAFGTDYTACTSHANIFLILCFASTSVACGKSLIERRSGNSETLRYLGNEQISFEKSAYHFQVLPTEFGWPPTFAGLEPVQLAVRQVSFRG
jgi:hypothetical protein